MAAGFLAGELARAVGAPWLASLNDQFLFPLGQIFLRLIFMAVLPLIGSAIVLGVMELGDLRKVGRIGVYSLLFTVSFAVISVGIGLALVNFVRPGEWMDQASRSSLIAEFQSSMPAATGPQAGSSVGQTLLALLPANPLYEAVYAFDAGAKGGILAFMIASVVFGIALAGIEKKDAQPLEAFLQSVFAVCMRVIELALTIAPFCVFFLGLNLGLKTGWTILFSLGAYIGVVIGGMLIHVFFTYGIALLTFAKKNPLRFFADVKEAFVTAFSTSSSNATLPVAIRVAEQSAGIRPTIARFVLTIGASANQNGTALYEGVTVLFLAQLFGVDLAISQQASVALVCILAGIGTAGVPGGSLPVVMGILVSVGVPGESMAIIIGIDRLLDMSRTTVNVVGDLVIAASVDKLTAPAEDRGA